MDFTPEKCPICYEPFNTYKKPYILLSCGHTFCSTCISQIKKECLEDEEKYISLNEFYHKQKKETNLCDSQASIFSDNCKKKSSISSNSSFSFEKDNNKKNNKSKDDEESYDELEENEENEEDEGKEEKKDKNKEDDDEDSDSDKKKGDKSDSENSNFNCEEDDFEEEDNESEEKNEEEESSEEESNENDDNSEKSFNNINDIIAINESNTNKEKEKKKKKIFKFKCPFCSVRIKITDKELIINENILKMNEIYNNENHANDDENNKNKYFCELCNCVMDHYTHYEKYGTEHDSYMFELNKNMFQRAFDNLNKFNSEKNKIITQAKKFLNGFNEKLIKDQELISNSKKTFIEYCQYNSKFVNVLKKSEKKLEKLDKTIKKKHEKNSGTNNYESKLKEEKELLEKAKSFNQLINGVFFFPQLKMKLISDKNENNNNNFLSSLYFDYSIKETYNQFLENGFFHFLRNKLYKTESKYIPFYSALTKRNFLFNSELNVLIKLKIPEKYSKSCYESSSDGSIVYCFSSKVSSKSSEFFSINTHSKKMKHLSNIPLTNYKVLDTIIFNDMKLFVIGGMDKYSSAITTCLYYNIKKNTWEKMPKLKYNRYNKALCINGKDLIAFGGKCEAKDSSYIFEKIDLNTLKNWENFTIKNFSANIYNFGYCSYNQDIIFVVGGEDQVTEDYVKKGYTINLKDKCVIEEFNIDDVLENNVHTPKCYRGIILSTDKELYNIDFFNVWKRLHKLNINLP